MIGYFSFFKLKKQKWVQKGASITKTWVRKGASITKKWVQKGASITKKWVQKGANYYKIPYKIGKICYYKDGGN